jgi:hypothetical protein
VTWLDAFLDSSARYSNMAKPWYAAKGKPYPGDPAQPLIDAVVANSGIPDKHIGLVVLSPEQVAKGIKPTK